MWPGVFFMAVPCSLVVSRSKSVLTERPIGNAIPVAQSLIDVTDTSSGGWNRVGLYLSDTR